MAEKVLMLALSPTMEEGVIVKWHKSEGDPVESGDVLCEVETDKAVMEYESQEEGTLLKILQDDGSRVSVGVPIGIIGNAGEDISDLLTETESESEKTAEAPAESEAPEAPAKEPAAPAPVSSADAKPAEEAPPSSTEKTRISPLARKLAEKHNLDISRIPGSGPYGRVVEKDIQDALSRPTTTAATMATTQVTIPSAVRLEEETVTLSEKRRVIAKRMSESKFSAPHYYLKLTAVIDGLIEARQNLNQRLGGKVSFNAFFVKLTAEALRRHPKVNASWNGDSIIFHGRIDMSLAVAQDDGLITPVVRNCESKGILEIENELKDLIDKARRNALQPPDYTDSTFTISNLGMFDIEEFTAIINQPNSAILTLGKMMKEPVFDDEDNLMVMQTMKLTLSCDHRVVDGAVGAAFLRDLKEMIENPIAALY